VRLLRWKKSCAVACSSAVCALLPRGALAEKTLLKTPDWEVYTDGRVGAFLSYTRGDGFPQPPRDMAGNQIHDIAGGGLNAQAERVDLGNGGLSQGTLERWRVRSGFIGNTLGLGVRGELDEQTKVTGFIQIWAYIESEQQRKNKPNPADLRQGYVKVEAPWGSVVAGRTRTLFSRGATDINVLYAHRYGVGYPGLVDTNGPTTGHIGFGVLGSGFAAGLIYATPPIAGVQLSLGVFDPIALQGAWTRTKLPRGETELTVEEPIPDIGKVVFFGNGAYQKLYKQDSSDNTLAWGFGYGARVEVGPVHLGLAGHKGTGLGLNYALEASDATLDAVGNLRKFDGYYVQSQVVLGQFDLSAGWGITRVFLGPQDSALDVNGHIPHSVVKSQMGISGVVVYHMKPWLHLDLDYFRADFSWFLGERQVVHTGSGGMTFTW
jgi:Gram-negative porin